MWRFLPSVIESYVQSDFFQRIPTPCKRPSSLRLLLQVHHELGRLLFDDDVQAYDKCKQHVQLVGSLSEQECEKSHYRSSLPPTNANHPSRRGEQEVQRVWNDAVLPGRMDCPGCLQKRNYGLTLSIKNWLWFKFEIKFLLFDISFNLLKFTN